MAEARSKTSQQITRIKPILRQEMYTLPGSTSHFDFQQYMQTKKKNQRAKINRFIDQTLQNPKNVLMLARELQKADR